MESINFEILRSKYPDLADLGGYAEQYAFSDPAAALVKLRTFGESLTHKIYEHNRLYRPAQRSFDSLLNHPLFLKLVPPMILDKLHSVRKQGNTGAHPGSVAEKGALSLLKDAHELSNWWAMQVLSANLESLPVFRMPSLRLPARDKFLPAEEIEIPWKPYQELTPGDEQLTIMRRTGQESADLVRLMPDEAGLKRGADLFSYLVQEANRGNAVGISYDGFITYIHGVEKFRQVMGRNYLPSDSGPVIRIAVAVTAKSGGRKEAGGTGRSIAAGMDTFIWQKQAPFDRSEKAWQNRHFKIPYSPQEWRSVFRDSARRMITAGELRKLAG